jgi:hypothetical protein
MIDAILAVFTIVAFCAGFCAGDLYRKAFNKVKP